MICRTINGTEEDAYIALNFWVMEISRNDGSFEGTLKVCRI